MPQANLEVSFQMMIKSPFLILYGMAKRAMAAKILIMVSVSPKLGKIPLIKVLKIHRNTVTPKMMSTIFSLPDVGPNFSSSV